MTTPKNPAIGRPRKFDTDAVIDAAVDLFWQNGYNATTTRALEASLGLTQSSLYNAFGSKQKLLEAAVERYQERVTDTLLVPLEQSDTGAQAIADFFAALSRWIAKDGRRGCLLINLMTESVGGDPTLDPDGAIADRTRRYRLRLRRGFRGALRRSVERGEMQGDVVDERAAMLVGLVLGINVAARGGASASELRALCGSVKVQLDGWRQPTT